MEILQRPIALRTGIGSAHDDTSTTAKDAQALYDQGLACLHAFVWIDAARSFNAALRLDPKLGLAHAGLSVAYVELNRPAEARAAIEAARALAPSLPDHDRRHIDIRALQMAAEDNPREGARLAAYRQALDAAIAAFPKDVESCCCAASPSRPIQPIVARAARRRRTYFERALALSPGNVAAHHYLTMPARTRRREERPEHGAVFAKPRPTFRTRTTCTATTCAARDASARPSPNSKRPTACIRKHQSRADSARVRLALRAQSRFARHIAAVHRTDQAGRAHAQGRVRAPDQPQQAVNKRQWLMFLRARGRTTKRWPRRRTLIGHPNPVIQAIGHIEVGFVMLTRSAGAMPPRRECRAQTDAHGAGRRHRRKALLALQGEYSLRTADRSRGARRSKMSPARARGAGSRRLERGALHTRSDRRGRACRRLGARRAHRAADARARPSYAGSHYARALAAEHDDDAARQRASSRWP